MKKKIMVLILMSMGFWYFSRIIAQNSGCLSCQSKWQSSAPFKIDDHSKSAMCYTGKKYEYLIKLEKGKDYRFSFFASSIFNNQINFRLLNNNTSDVLLSLPGISSGNGQMGLLEDYYDEKSKQMVHPFFDVAIKANVEIKIIIDVLPSEDYTASLNDEFQFERNLVRGCVTVFIQSKQTEADGF